MTHTTGQQDIRLWEIFEKRLEKIAEETGYFEEPIESEAYRRFDAAWVAYLGGLGIERVYRDFQVTESEGDYTMQDPLYTSGMGLRIPKEVLEKIMTLGLP